MPSLSTKSSAAKWSKRHSTSAIGKRDIVGRETRQKELSNNVTLPPCQELFLLPPNKSLLKPLDRLPHTTLALKEEPRCGAKYIEGREPTRKPKNQPAPAHLEPLPKQNILAFYKSSKPMKQIKEMYPEIPNSAFSFWDELVFCCILHVHAMHYRTRASMTQCKYIVLQMH